MARILSIETSAILMGQASVAYVFTKLLHQQGCTIHHIRLTCLIDSTRPTQRFDRVPGNLRE